MIIDDSVRACINAHSKLKKEVQYEGVLRIKSNIPLWHKNSNGRYQTFEIEIVHCANSAQKVAVDIANINNILDNGDWRDTLDKEIRRTYQVLEHFGETLICYPELIDDGNYQSHSSDALQCEWNITKTDRAFSAIL